MTGATELALRIGAAARHPSNWVQLFKFGLVGGSGYLINLAVFAFVTDLFGVHHIPAAIAAFVVAVSNNFWWNRHWTFAAPGDAGHGGAVHFQAARFFAVSIAGLAINLAVLQLLIASASFGDLAAQAVAVAVAMPFNFICNRLWTFA